MYTSFKFQCRRRELRHLSLLPDPLSSLLYPVTQCAATPCGVRTSPLSLRGVSLPHPRYLPPSPYVHRAAGRSTGSACQTTLTSTPTPLQG